MKILFLAQFPLFGNGSGNYTRKLGEQLVKDGHEVAIAAPDNRKVNGCKIYTIKPAIKAVFISHPEWKRSPTYASLNANQILNIYLSYLRQITKIVDHFKPDVIHVNHCFFLAWIANIIRSIYGIGYVITVHGTDIYQNTIDNRFMVLSKQGVSRACSIVCVSNHTRKWLFKVFGKNLKPKTRIITGGIDLDSYKVFRDTSALDRKYNLKDKKVVIFVGRLTKEKGVEYLIKASKKIKGEIYIIGDGIWKKYLQNLSSQIGTKNVHFLGYFGKNYINELKDFYTRADVAVLPSVVDESLGLVVLEAMVCRTPIVASRKGGIPLAVKDNWNGFLVRPRSAKAITEAVNKILTEPELAKNFGVNARKIVEERFSWQMIAPNVEKIYEKTYEITKKYSRRHRLEKFSEQDIKREKIELKKKVGYVP